MPAVSPDLAPNCLALYLGCRGVEKPGTVWCEPFIEDPDDLDLRYDPENFYWTFTLKLAKRQLQIGRGKFLVAFPDLIEGLDTLAAMRGTKNLLLDLNRHPDWVHAALRRITDLYFHYYDVLYGPIRDEVGGSILWAWAPGRRAKFQCDFSTMISPRMFEEFMLLTLTEMCERVSYCMYHWDGPRALVHHDLLLSLPDLKMIQWTPNVGVEPPWHRRWWPIYHKTVEAGMKLYIGCDSIESLRALKLEFGDELKQFMISMNASSLKEAKQILELVTD